MSIQPNIMLLINSIIIIMIFALLLFLVSKTNFYDVGDLESVEMFFLDEVFVEWPIADIVRRPGGMNPLIQILTVSFKNAFYHSVPSVNCISVFAPLSAFGCNLKIVS
jgi:hypothetical protein